MPCFAALAFTASRSVRGSRMLTRSVFGSNSNLTIRISERSYCVRSEFATKASASLSLLSFGNFFFIEPDLSLVHVTRADWPDERSTVLHTQCEHDKHIPFLGRNADCDEPLLRPCAARRMDRHRSSKQRLDVFERNSMPATLV